MTEAHDDETLRDEGARIETLLDEVAGAVGPATGSRLHELMQRMVGLYGAGLGRVLAHARAAAASEDDLLERLCADELVSSLLLLYEMHPRSPEERIEAALARARPYLGSHGGDVLLLGLDGDVARLRLLGSCDGCPSSAATVERTLERAILDAAPEASRVEVEGLQRPSVPLARLESKPRPKRLRLDGLQVRSRAVRTWESDGARLAIVGTAEQVLAYRDRCGGCSATLAGARLSGDLLECSACGRQFDVVRGGRSAGDAAAHLEPVSLFVDDDGTRVAMLESSP